MASMVKISLLCVFAIFCLTQIEARITSLNKNDDMGEGKDVGDGRGILDNVLNVLRPGQPSNINVLPPNVFPETAVAPTVILPSIPAANANRPIATFLQNILSNDLTDGDFNKRWLNYALQRCARIDPKSLTAILPTTANGLRAPKLYYFQNETSGALLWHQAQEWCTTRGMNLVTVNDANENKVLIEKLRAILAGATPGTITPAAGATPAFNNPNPTSFWIGLNALNSGNVASWVGDGTSTFTDWHANAVEPNPAARYCALYNQVTSVDNIKMDAFDCLGATNKFRYICEVSDECTAIFFSRLHKIMHTHNNGNLPHVHTLTG